MKSTGKGACILPHGVLFRGNAEAVIRQQLVRSGYLKGIIGLPANLFYGTGIPACIVVLDKEKATARKGIFMIDASKGFKKDGPKNRLREQDIHKIVDTFTRQTNDPRYARMVSHRRNQPIRRTTTISTSRATLTAPNRRTCRTSTGICAAAFQSGTSTTLGSLLEVLPDVRTALFEARPLWLLPVAARLSPRSRPPYLATPSSLHSTHRNEALRQVEEGHRSALEGFAKDGHPKHSSRIAEDLLATFKTAPLLDAYDMYQHLMDYWAETMQDDCYLIAADGWKAGAQPREIRQVKNKDGKLVWPEPHDFKKGKRRFKSDLIPAAILIARYFAASGMPSPPSKPKSRD